MRPGDQTVLACCSLLAIVAGSDSAAPNDNRAPIDFGMDVRPILSDKCFTCHGPDDQLGGFRLDDKSSAFGEADSGLRPIVPGDVVRSEVVNRILSDDEGTRMPPPDAPKQLTPEEKLLIRNWVAQGADWQEHWSFIPPSASKVPQVEEARWPRNSIDHFILAKLESEGLQPSPAASKETLLRRVTLDLTGLPPSVDQMTGFLADDSATAYERTVDRLLDSPHYGEHMARFWLDAARYADTNGLHLDNYREMWPYRDWVINAFNRDLPFDQFVVDQLAGDLLPNPTDEQRVATGFNRAHVTTNEGGSIAEEIYVRNVVDRVTTFGTVFMGLTLECSRCHDHKYDPLSMEDFYSLSGFFNSLDANPMDGNKKDHAPVIKVPTREQTRELESTDQQIVALEEKLLQDWDELDSEQQEWEQDLQSSIELSPELLLLGEWYSVGPFSDNSRYLRKNHEHGPEGKPIDLAERFTIETGEDIAWQHRAEWQDGVVHQDFSGETAANFVYRTIYAPKAMEVTIQFGSGDGYRIYLNGEQVYRENIEREVAPNQDELMLQLSEGENHLLIKLLNFGGETGFYFQFDSEIDTVSGELVVTTQTPSSERTSRQRRLIREIFRSRFANHPAVVEIRQQLRKLRKRKSDIERQIATSLVWKELDEPRPAYLLVRGEYDHQGEEQVRRTPSVLPPMPDGLPRDRLGLAKWLLIPEHPLTARVAVNRFWQQVFGTGLVRTAEDFGAQGERPSHPELLDWLARDFVASGWDVKALMKMIVMSETYRQSSRVNPEVYRRDPANRLLARGARYRLDAEMLRDQALFVSGLLVPRIGGASVKPPQPDGLWKSVGYTDSNTVAFVADVSPEKIHRRTLYTFIKRTAPPPQMSVFDGPSRETCIMRRERTNTPLQALLLMNDPQYVEAARMLAARTLREGGPDDAAKAAFMFRLCTGREPADADLRDLLEAVRQERHLLRSDSSTWEDALSAVLPQEAAEFDTLDWAAWTVIANTLLNMDEVISRN